LKGAARGAAQTLAEWREKRAMTTNVPVRRILGDMALVSIAQAAPKSTEDLAHVRGVDERSLGGSVGREILAAVRDGVTRNVSLPVADGEGVDKRMRPLVTLITAWIAELARQHELDPALLATTKDVIGYVGGGSSRLSSGWRRDLVGEDLEKLMSGRAGLGFAPHGGLVLIHTDK
jgi:ribonuclease D